MGENEALQKEIDDAKNSKFLNDLRNIYTGRYRKYKEEFYSAAKGDPKKYNCFLQSMWANGGTKEIDVIKKIILAECF